MNIHSLTLTAGATNVIKQAFGTVPDAVDMLVLFGRGHYNQVGNQSFLALVSHFVANYRNTTTQKERTVIINTILDTVMNTGLIFLKKNKDKVWSLATTEEIREKIAHAIRDKLTKSNQGEEDKEVGQAPDEIPPATNQTVTHPATAQRERQVPYLLEGSIESIPVRRVDPPNQTSLEEEFGEMIDEDTLMLAEPHFGPLSFGADSIERPDLDTQDHEINFDIQDMDDIGEHQTGYLFEGITEPISLCQQVKLPYQEHLTEEELEDMVFELFEEETVMGAESDFEPLPPLNQDLIESPELDNYDLDLNDDTFEDVEETEFELETGANRDLFPIVFSHVGHHSFS